MPYCGIVLYHVAKFPIAEFSELLSETRGYSIYMEGEGILILKHFLGSIKDCSETGTEFISLSSLLIFSPSIYRYHI